jgi:hypothetical protein
VQGHRADDVQPGRQAPLGEDDGQRHGAHSLRHGGVVEPQAQTRFTDGQPDAEVEQQARQAGARGHANRRHPQQQHGRDDEDDDLETVRRHVRGHG